jgi:hypothetical protein
MDGEAVFPRAYTNAEVRFRAYLTPSEIEKLRKAARSMGRHGVRKDA